MKKVERGNKVEGKRDGARERGSKVTRLKRNLCLSRVTSNFSRGYEPCMQHKPKKITQHTQVHHHPDAKFNI